MFIIKKGCVRVDCCFTIMNVVRSSPLQELAFRGEHGSLLGGLRGLQFALFPAGVKFLPLLFTYRFKYLE
ncbi:hypothetical protein HMPREF3291_14995 [Bacillus sp. HMSC76G11]|nr:hypothetical protein HMPREF3291_14995 [Bacillus sp. HMSC76G11]